MKKIKIFLSLFLFCIVLSNCSDKDYRYVDINSGKRMNVVKDSTTGRMIDEETKEPVAGIYYDTKTKDTLNVDGDIINNKVTRTPDGKYTFDEQNDRRTQGVRLDTSGIGDIKEGDDVKEKVQGDGDLKIKAGDTKIKIKSNGDTKVKTDK